MAVFKKCALDMLIEAAAADLGATATRLLPPLINDCAALPRGAGFAIALSAGADSAMLAVAAAHVARSQARPLVAFHVHHGLMSEADAWADAAVRLGSVLRIPVQVARVRVPVGSSGIEAAARHARYAALAELAQAQGIQHLFLAHHRDDQAETVLLRLLRGSGVAGMAAMRSKTRRDGLEYWRPWLNVARADILAAAQVFASRTTWRAVQDPSNNDARYTRAAVRTALTPLLTARWPEWQTIVARHAQHMAETADFIDEVARADFATLDPTSDGRSFGLAQWRALSPARQAQVLRHWLEEQGLRMPTSARLSDLMRQLRGLHALGHDRHLCVLHEGYCIRCHRGRVWLEVNAKP